MLPPKIEKLKRQIGHPSFQSLKCKTYAGHLILKKSPQVILTLTTGALIVVGRCLRNENLVSIHLCL